MIVVDTNVLSEPLRAVPSTRVLGWLATPGDDVYVTSVTVGEILRGVRLMPEGRRRRELWSGIDSLLGRFRHQVLDYDIRAAEQYAFLSEERRRAGRAISVEDGMIAAICLVHGARLATRNTKDFDELGIELIDPWV